MEVDALEVDALAVITVLSTSTDAINQTPYDELYLAPVNSTAYIFHPDRIAHMLSWERLFVSVNGLESPKNQRWASWTNRNDFVRENKHDQGLDPLIQFTATEFLIKPHRFLRGNTLLASMADTLR